MAVVDSVTWKLAGENRASLADRLRTQSWWILREAPGVAKVHGSVAFVHVAALMEEAAALIEELKADRDTALEARDSAAMLLNEGHAAIPHPKE